MPSTSELRKTLSPRRDGLIRDVSATVGLTWAATPEPLSAELKVPALVVIVSEPVKAPAERGWKETEKLHAAPAASDDEQVAFVRLKSFGSAPVTPAVEIVKAEVPVLVMVTSWTALATPTVSLPKLIEAGVTLAAGAAVPVPVRVVVRVPALVTTVRDAENAAALKGENATV